VARRTSTKTSPNLINKTIQKITDMDVFPFVVAFTCLGILFVLIRMKGVEQDYHAHEVSNKIKQVTIENKELKADKARLLSTKNLKRMATKYKLKEPEEKQIIIIP
jgi:cell division protein FtsL